MRRVFSYALAALTVFALAACSTPAPAATEPTAPAAPAAAPAATLGALTISDPWVRPVSLAMPTPEPNATPMAMGGEMAGVVTGGYMMIANSGAEADALIGASTTSDLVEVVELHTVTNENGVMKMSPVEQIDVPANGEAVLKPGGFHVMFIGVKQELKPGDIVKLSLTFAKAGTIEVDAVVRPANPMP